MTSVWKNRCSTGPVHRTRWTFGVAAGVGPACGGTLAGLLTPAVTARGGTGVWPGPDEQADRAMRTSAAGTARELPPGRRARPPIRRSYGRNAPALPAVSAFVVRE